MAPPGSVNIVGKRYSMIVHTGFNAEATLTAVEGAVVIGRLLNALLKLPGWWSVRYQNGITGIEIVRDLR